MKQLQRYISFLLCLALLLMGSVAFTEEEAAQPAAQAQEPEPASTPEPTPTPTPAPTPEETLEPTPPPTAAPTKEPAEDEVQEAPDPDPDPEPEPVPAVSFDQSRLTYMLSDIADDFDYVREFKPKVENADGALIWSTDDVKIAEFVTLDSADMEPVDADTREEDIIVVLRAYKPGRVAVRAALLEDPGVYAEFELILEEEAAPVYALTLSEAEKALNVGESCQLSAAFTADSAPVEGAALSWRSSDEAVATVDETGLVSARGKGAATITVSIEYGGSVYSASCALTVSLPVQSITAKNIEFWSDGSATLAVSPVPADADFDPALLSYAVEPAHAGLIQVDAGGEVAAVTQNGLLNTTDSFVKANVHVSYGALSAAAEVTVFQAATSIAIEGDARHVWLGKTAPLGVVVLPQNAHDGVAAYASSDEGIFTIDREGVIKGLKLGGAKATVGMRSGRTLDFPVSVLQGSDSLRLAAPSGNLKMGDVIQLTLTRVPVSAVDKITWESSDESLAKVDETGKVTLIAPGRALIFATSETGASTSVGLDIIRPAAAITFYQDAYPGFSGFILAPGQLATPTVAVLPADATKTGYALSSSDERIARVAGARVQGVKSGLATITAVSADGEVSRTFLVKVVPKSKMIKTLTVNRSSLSLKEGTSYTLKGRINSGAQSKTVLWASLNPAVATVSAKGVVKAVYPGTTYIYAMSLSGITKKVKVTVTAQLPTRVRINKSSATLYPDKTIKLSAALTPKNIPQAKNRAIIWQTSNKRVAVVSDAGLVTGISPGTAYITAKTVNGKTHRCRITVKKKLVTSVKIKNPYGTLVVGGAYTMDVSVGPADATDPGVKWSLDTKSKKLASVNANTGALSCKKPGTIKLTATAKDGSRKKHTITLKIVAAPLVSFSIARDGAVIERGARIELAYKQSFAATVAVEPAFFIEWKSSNPRVASVKGGVVTATGAGTATITAVASGLHTYSFDVFVPKGEDQPTYRGLVVAQYLTSSKKGYLSFGKKAQKGVYDALGESDVDGARYELSYRSNLTSAAQLTSAISSTFSDAVEGDVSFIYLLSHGTYKDGSYVWHLHSESGGAYVPAETIMSAIKGIKGHVVLVIPSCYSGGDEEIPTTLTYMVRAADRAAGEGSSVSGLFASDGLVRASYFETHERLSYDFFTYSMCKALGLDYVSGKSVSLSADKNGDGFVTLSELAAKTQSLTADTLSAYFKAYGSSSYYGPPSKSQNVTYYVSPKASSLKILGK